MNKNVSDIFAISHSTFGVDEEGQRENLKPGA